MGSRPRRNALNAPGLVVVGGAEEKAVQFLRGAVAPWPLNKACHLPILPLPQHLAGAGEGIFYLLGDLGQGFAPPPGANQKRRLPLHDAALIPLVLAANRTGKYNSSFLASTPARPPVPELEKTRARKFPGHASYMALRRPPSELCWRTTFLVKAFFV